MYVHLNNDDNEREEDVDYLCAYFFRPENRLPPALTKLFSTPSITNCVFSYLFQLN